MSLEIRDTHITPGYHSTKLYVCQPMPDTSRRLIMGSTVIYFTFLHSCSMLERIIQDKCCFGPRDKIVLRFYFFLLPEEGTILVKVTIEVRSHFADP